jgi:hypothetical protein
LDGVDRDAVALALSDDALGGSVSSDLVERAVCRRLYRPAEIVEDLRAAGDVLVGEAH